VSPEWRDAVVQLAYLAASVLFIFSLKWMNSPQSARRGVWAGVWAMVLGIGGTLLNPAVAVSSLPWIALAVMVGGLIGVPLSKVPLTAVPQRTALSHAFGGLAAGLVGTAKYYLWIHEGGHNLTTFRMFAISAEVILGFLTFTGSLMAAGKLQEILPGRPITYRGQLIVNFLTLGGAIACAVGLIINPQLTFLFPLLIILSSLPGRSTVRPD
jgi:NAD(P) transhydrogenase subunit beta